MATSLQGTLSLYPLPKSSWQRRPFFTSGDQTAERTVLFIGGLHSGMLSGPFIVPLSDALASAGWRLDQIHWSGSYDGFGTGSLDRDCDEIEALVDHLAEEGVTTVVLAGHSTGSQDVLRYLTTKRQWVRGGIMISPASDREFYEKGKDPLWADQLSIAQKLLDEGRKDQILDDKMTEAFGARVTAYRLHSLIGVGGDDDYFSSDIPDVPDGSKHVHPLSTSFGKLQVPVRALWMENDHCAILPDQRSLLRRWEAASGGKLSWAVIEGASHSVDEEDAQTILCKDITVWLANQFGDSD